MMQQSNVLNLRSLLTVVRGMRIFRLPQFNSVFVHAK